LIYTTPLGNNYTLKTIVVPVARNSPQPLSFDLNLNDDIIEGTEMFYLVISPTSWCGLVSGNTAQVTIINNEGTHCMLM